MPRGPNKFDWPGFRSSSSLRTTSIASSLLSVVCSKQLLRVCLPHYSRFSVIQVSRRRTADSVSETTKPHRVFDTASFNYLLLLHTSHIDGYIFYRCLMTVYLVRSEPALVVYHLRRLRWTKTRRSTTSMSVRAG